MGNKKKITKKPVKKLTEQQQKCLECQECCEYVEYPITMLGPEVVEYFMMRGDTFYIDTAGVLMNRVLKPCINLLKKGGCGIYDKRPHTCKVYMCSEKDNRVKQVKDAACQKCLSEVRVIIEAHNKKERE